MAVIVTPEDMATEAPRLAPSGKNASSSAVLEQAQMQLYEALNDPDPRLYVLNQSRQNTFDNRDPHSIPVTGQTLTISMSVITGGRPFRVSIPRTWIPVDLSAQAPKHDILNSQSFRVYLNNRTIKIIPVSVAEDVLQTPEARAEIEAMYRAKENAAKNSLVAAIHANVSAEGVPAIFTESMSRADATETDILNVLRTNEGLVNRAVLLYLLRTVNPENREVIDWAARRLTIS